MAKAPEGSENDQIKWSPPPLNRLQPSSAEALLPHFSKRMSPTSPQRLRRALKSHRAVREASPADVVTLHKWSDQVLCEGFHPALGCCRMLSESPQCFVEPVCRELLARGVDFSGETGGSEAGTPEEGVQLDEHLLSNLPRALLQCPEAVLRGWPL